MPTHIQRQGDFPGELHLGTAAPAAPADGDVWFDGQTFRRYVVDTWVTGSITVADDFGQNFTVSTAAPASPDLEDVWFDGQHLYRWAGGLWAPMSARIGDDFGADVVFSLAEPASPTDDDVWYDKANGQFKRRVAAAWEVIGGAGGGAVDPTVVVLTGANVVHRTSAVAPASAGSGLPMGMPLPDAAVNRLYYAADIPLSWATFTMEITAVELTGNSTTYAANLAVEFVPFDTIDLNDEFGQNFAAQNVTIPPVESFGGPFQNVVSIPGTANAMLNELRGFIQITLTRDGNAGGDTLPGTLYVPSVILTKAS